MTITVSYSEIVSWQICQRKHFYSFTLGLRPAEESDALSTGIKGHKLLQTFYGYLGEGKHQDEALDLTQKSAAKEINASKFPDFNLLKAWNLVQKYVSETDFTAEAIIVENRYLIPANHLTDDPFFRDVQIGFTPDLVMQRKGNKLDIEDAKFVERAWSKKKKNRFGQVRLYQIFLERMGYDISRSILRFFNTKTWVIDEQNYVMSKAAEKILIEDFLVGVRDVVTAKRKPEHTLKFAPRTMNNGACQFCEYEYICSLEAEGKDASNSMTTLYVKSKYGYE